MQHKSKNNLLLSKQKHKAVTLSPPQVVLCDIVLVPPSLKVSNTVSSACRFIGQTGSPVEGTKGKLYYAKKSLPYRKKSSGTHSFRWLPPRAVTTPFTYGVACPDLLACGPGYVVCSSTLVPVVVQLVVGFGWASLAFAPPVELVSAGYGLASSASSPPGREPAPVLSVRRRGGCWPSLLHCGSPPQSTSSPRSWSSGIAWCVASPAFCGSTSASLSPPRWSS